MVFKEIRKTFGTQSALADLLGIHSSTICKWEKGICYPKWSMLNKMSKLFGISEFMLITLLDNGVKESSGI